MRPSVAVVVLNWNGVDDTISCLESLRNATIPVHVIVVDNGSTDDSVQRIEALDLADELISTGANLGYAAGNNAGLRLALDAGFDVVAILNNDTIVAGDALKLLLEELPATEPRAVSPDIRYFDRPGESWFAGGVIDRGWPRHLQPAELAGDDLAPRSSECLSGCCIVARRETWELVGLFDPSYFMIFEDSDWSMRALRHGVSLYVVPTSMVQHRVSSSFKDASASLLGSYYFARNGLRFEARYFATRLPRFTFQWLIRPIPALARNRRVGELAFRWLGALAFATRRSGRAPRIVERLASRTTR
jgi:GT2 family glycosyltransferase